MLIGSVGCGFTAYYVQSFFETMIKLPSGVGAFASLAVSIAVAGVAGLSVFVGVCLAAKLEEPNLVLKRFLKKRK
jgi:hypothetical protein